MFVVAEKLDYLHVEFQNALDCDSGYRNAHQNKKDPNSVGVVEYIRIHS
jgi:hypothetical protein